MLTISAHEALEKYFGYTQFRPLQEEIVQDILAKKDVFVLMPTGGGKSLCYQLPSTLLPGITIVISPLISLMKNQVDTLTQMGIPAAFLNSSLSLQEQRGVLERLKTNKLRLLYVAPERLVQESFLALLKALPLNFFAIDEAHCISQWGHDFRPEYRQLRLLRNHFPGIPIAALTATATERVKADIVEQLSLVRPGMYQASFNRPNLTYTIHPKKNAFQSMLVYMQEHAGDSGIIYCQSRKTVERITKKLNERGIRALPYHAGLPDEERKGNQERFIKDDAQIIVATIAFGMGIDKPNVRYVFHYDLPKSIENYYQETGRAGRDGLPSNCIFFFSIGDKYFYDRFIGDKADKNEQQIAKQQLQTVITYAQSRVCRRIQLLKYFNEDYSSVTCASCDNCLSPQETFDGTTIAQKILSCVYRVHGNFGANHIVQIVTGAQTKRILERNHHLLSTYNILSEYSADDVKMFLYELLQQGYLKQSDDQYALISLTPLSTPVLRGIKEVTLTKPEETLTLATKDAEEIPVDTQLFERLRILRKKLAEEKNVPPYVIFPDTSLKDMAASQPKTREEFAQIYGVGEKKLKEFAEVFLKELVAYSSTHKN